MKSTSSTYAKLATEKSNPASRHFDRVSISKAIQIMNKEDAKVPFAVQRERKSLEKGVRAIVQSLKSGGRVFFIGAGTSGRLGVLEAAECPPTFNTPPELVQAFMAGGSSSVFASKEGAEDSGSDSVKIINKYIRPGDAVVGVAASGVTAFVRDGLRAARLKGARTIFVTCNPAVPKTLADVTIAVNSGPEVIAGSTRLKAGTATKLVLNTLTVVAMTQMGKVLGNRMIDLQPKSKKLRARAVGLIRLFTGVSEKTAEEALEKSGRSVKAAVLMLEKKIDVHQARQRLKLAEGHLHKALRFQL
jgi:N-acetylmuramic acid 6-phosphate etherase